MIDPYVFDQCDRNEEAIETAKRKAKEQRKRAKDLIAASSIIRAVIHDNDLFYDYDEDYDDWSDEIYND